MRVSLPDKSRRARRLLGATTAGYVSLDIGTAGEGLLEMGAPPPHTPATRLLEIYQHSKTACLRLPISSRNPFDREIKNVKQNGEP